MTSKKSLIILGVIIGTVVVLVGGASLLIRFLVTPEMIRKNVLPRLENALQRRIEMNDAKIGLFSGIALRGLTVYERDGKGPFVSLKEARLHYQILPLLSRRVVVDELVLDTPAIHVARNSEGSFNFSDLIKKEKPKTAEQHGKTSFTFAVAKIRITDGRVDYDDRKGIAGSPFIYEVRDISLNVKNFSPDHSFPVTLKATIPGAKLGFTGTVEKITDTPAVDGQITVTDTDVAKLAAGLPAGVSAKILSLSPSGAITAVIHVAGSVNKPMAMLKEGEILLKDIQLAAGGQRAVLSGAVNLSNGALSSHDFAIALGKDRLAIEMKTSPLDEKPIKVVLSATSDSLKLDTVLATKKAKATVQPSPPHAADTEPGAFKLPLFASGGIRVKTATYKGLVISGLSLRYQLAENVLDILDLKGNMAGGNFTDSARIDLATPGFSYSTRLSLQGVQVDRLVAAFAPKSAGRISGILSAKADLSGHGTMAVAAKRNLAGTGDFQLKKGKVASGGFVNELARFLGSEELRVVRFSEFSGIYQVKKGQIFLDSELDGSDIRMKPKGRIGFDKSLDMVIDTGIAPNITGKLTRGTVGSYLTDAEGWAVIPLKATGTIDSPHFSVSGKNLGRRLGEKAGEIIRKDLGKGIGRDVNQERQKLEDKLKGFFGK
jgi:AsmA protein